MCLYPKLIPNPKYRPNKKNNYRPPAVTDKRTLLIPVGCQKCMECMKQKARGWSIRLQEEIGQHKRGHKHFITLTFNTEALKGLIDDIAKDCNKHGTEAPKGYDLDNEIATLAVRRFTERWRAKYGTTIKHWLVTELGHKNTEHVHLHGILFTESVAEIAKMWKYGYVWAGSYVNERTINYVIKYCTKMDNHHKEYKPKILTSKGIGRTYLDSSGARMNKFNTQGETRETYITRQGYKIALPAYYRNHIYTDQQKEQLWIQKLDKKERWVDKSRVSIANGDQEYYRVLQQARLKNQRLGYGTDELNWDQKQYEQQRRELLYAKRLEGNRGSDIPTPEPIPLERRGDRNTLNSIETATRWLQKMANKSTKPKDT